ncbi:MAG TPA: FAD binding domain-containing protein, partial [Candidatus Binatia bacterium]|nr:FAD binding domain-containing protein [Candidatus Binatia bacterium]
MKPASFEYFAPQSLSEALRMLDRYQDTARPLAGGQSLVPMMNMRLARPDQIIDLNGLREMDYLKIENNELRIGAMTRQRALEQSSLVRTACPLLVEAVQQIGHIQIRNRGTVGGSVAHAYPGAELPITMLALEASFVLRSERHERMVAAREFFVDAMSTVLAPGELLTEIRVPKTEAGTGSAFQEISRRYGDFALAAVAGTITLRPDGTIDRASLVFSGSKPQPANNTDKLIGGRPSRSLFEQIANDAAAELEFE